MVKFTIIKLSNGKHIHQKYPTKGVNYDSLTLNLTVSNGGHHETHLFSGSKHSYNQEDC